METSAGYQEKLEIAAPIANMILVKFVVAGWPALVTLYHEITMYEETSDEHYWQCEILINMQFSKEHGQFEMIEKHGRNSLLEEVCY